MPWCVLPSASSSDLLQLFLFTFGAAEGFWWRPELGSQPWGSDVHCLCRRAVVSSAAIQKAGAVGEVFSSAAA